MTKVYNPTNLEVASLFSRVLCDKAPSQKTDALFIHGELADLRIEEPLLLKAYKAWKDGLCELIVINGLTAKDCKKRNHGYRGYERYLAKLKKLGVPENSILIIPPSENTGLESQNFLLMAYDRNWHNLMIEAAPYHQARWFLQAVAANKKI